MCDNKSGCFGLALTLNPYFGLHALARNWLWEQTIALWTEYVVPLRLRIFRSE